MINNLQPSNVYSGFFLAFALSYHGLLKKKLSKSGALAAFFVGLFSFMSSPKSGILLVQFYYLGSKATKIGSAKKDRLDSSSLDSGVRGASQVLACSILGTFCAVLESFVFGSGSVQGGILWRAQVAHYSCCLGDTFASELGMLGGGGTFSIVPPFKRVPRGANGGVSFAGFVWSAVGGGLIGTMAGVGEQIGRGGLTSGEASKGVIAMTVFGGVVGLFGSVVDSILGATVQPTYYDKEKRCIVKSHSSKSVIHLSGLHILSNAQVNLVSVLISMIFGTIIGEHFQR